MAFWIGDWQVAPVIARRNIMHAQWAAYCLVYVQIGATGIGLGYWRHRHG